MKKATLLLFLFSLILNCNAFNITGVVTESSKKPLAFVSVFISGSSQGCSTNERGYYKLRVEKDGIYELSFSMIGYKKKIQSITISGSDIIVNVTLDKSELMLREVVISAKDEDPAYRIIRETIKKKDFYLENPKAFSIGVYNKNLVRIKYPESFMGIKKEKIIEKNEMSKLDSLGRDVIYFSETVSRLYIEKPDKMKEVMISSKISGDKNDYSFNTASLMLINFYESNISGFSKRGLISPISSSAFLYYKFRLEGTFIENNNVVSKIKVIPKRKSDPVFSGYIFIVEDKWNIHSADLLATKEGQLELFDSLRVQQLYAPIDSNVWMPVSSKIDYFINMLGFGIDGYFIGFQSGYDLHPNFEKGFFNAETSKVEEGANKKDSSYWESVRPIALTKDEVKDYHVKDSMEIRVSSKQYRDSVDKKNNQFKFGTLLWKPYNFERSYSHYSLRITPLINSIQFNTVEGIALNAKIVYDKHLEKNRSYSLSGVVRYGFSNGHLNGTLRWDQRIKPEKFMGITVSGGKNIYQYDGSEPVTPLVNTYYTLIEKLNYAKYYEKWFGQAQFRTELTNGIYFDASAGYNYRLPLINADTFCFNTATVRKYTSNDPQFEDNKDYPFSKAGNGTIEAEVGFRFRIKQEYSTEPNRKYVEASKFPEFEIRYHKAFGDADYDFVNANIKHHQRIGMLGFFNFNLEYGYFINNSKMSFMDYHHFRGNQTIFLQKLSGNNSNNRSITIGGSGSADNLAGFNFLPYYSYSTNVQYFEVHFEQHFCGWILNKIPLIKKLRLHEAVGIHYLKNDKINNYFEINAGLEHIGIPFLKIPIYFRVDFVAAFDESKNIPMGVRIGMGF